MFQILENIKEFSAPEQRKTLEQRFGKEVCDRFFACNFKQQLRITIAENSDKPRSMTLTQANIMAFGQLAAQLGKVPWGAELLSTIADTLGIPWSLGEGRNDRKEAENRLSKLHAIAARIEERDPALYADDQKCADFMFTQLAKFCYPLIELVREDEDIETEPFNPAGVFMQDHAAFMDVYKDYIFSTEGQMAKPAKKLVVIQLYMEHFKAKLMVEQEMGQLQKELVESLQPAEPTPEELAAAADAQGEALAATEQKQLQAAAIRYEADEEAKDAELERDLVRAEHGAMINVATQPQGASQ
jgi:hypothetical protein